VGSAVSKSGHGHRFSPVISPKKTVEGCIGGVVGSTIICGVFSWFFMPHFFVPSLILGACGAVCAELGDLVASAIKRCLGIKDYSNLIPGHGGIMDRIGFHIKPMIALMCGSIPLTGGHGNAGSFAPIAESYGFVGATTVAMAAATFGLVTGGLLGGPTASRLIEKRRLMDKASRDIGIDASLLQTKPGNVNQIATSFFLIVIAGSIGAVIWAILAARKITLPIHVLGMLVGAIFRIVMDGIKVENPEDVIDRLGNVFLGVFVSMAILSMQLWQLFALAVPVITILLVQLLVIWAFARFITFPLMGRDYDAAVISAGLIGFGLGAVPVSMANMDALTRKYRYSKIAYFVVPIIGALFSNFTNAAIITLWMSWCR
jgi:ESS family glutamate:Na+ symporter